MKETPDKEPLRLSAGELGFVLNALYMEQEALDLVQTQLGMEEPGDAQLVIATAGHSLLARGLASIAADDSYELELPLTEAVGLLAAADWMIQCNRSAGGALAFISFHFGAGGVLKHSTRDGVVHELEIIPDLGHAIAAAADFYGATKSVPRPLPTVRLQEELLEEIRDSADEAYVWNRLSQAQIDSEVRQLLVGDLIDPPFRGSVVRVDHHPGGTSIAEHRLFLLGGATRLWLLRPHVSETERYVNLIQGSHENLANVFRHIVNEPAPKWRG